MSEPTPFARRTTAGQGGRVDVVMPFFNHGAFIDEALASVRRQTHPVARVLVVDDGSTDAYSLDVLARLAEEPDLEVLHQANRGPGSARNRGARASSAEAVVFLDADDRMEDDHVAVALAALEGAPAYVGFAYPDQQSFGTLDDLMVMPAYNLFTLTQFNYCGTGCIVDRGVFDAGHAFAEELGSGHEDWEFFLRIGAAGIAGVDFHGPALDWRRWGFSRSDGINERTLSYEDELRTLLPEVFGPTHLVSLKSRWSPALSVVVDEAPATVAAQTCGDYEVVSCAAGTPSVRGRWVAVLGGTAAGLLDDETFVERVLRIVDDGAAGPAMLLSTSAEPPGPVRWQRSDPTPGSVADAAVVDGTTFGQWSAAAGGGGAETLVTALATEAGGAAHWRWSGPPPARGARRRGVGVEQVRAPLPPPAPGALPAGLSPERAARAEERGAEAIAKERSFRYGTPTLFVPRSGPRRLPCGPPRPWAPSPTVALDLVVSASGEAILRAVRGGSGAPADGDDTGAPRITLGRIWAKGFPGTNGIYDRIDLYSHGHAYRAAAGPANAGEARLGFAATEQMSGTVSLTERLEWGVAALGGRGILVHLPEVVFEDGEVYLEPAGDATPAPPRRRGRLAPYLSGAGGLGATLYELPLGGGRVRYSTHPDHAVAHPELGSADGVAVAELGPPDGATGGPLLHEVPAPEGGISYVTAPARPTGQAPEQPVFGALGAGEGSGAPLIRLRPGAALPQPAGEAGTRLAVDWRPLGDLGYEPEGSVGFVWPVDRLEAPLYRWRRPGTTTRLLTLGHRPVHGTWEFAGTLGVAWRPHATWSGLVGLWELSAGDQLVYAVDPAEFTAVGFTCERVVAKISVGPRPGSVPLWRTAVGNDSPWRFTTSPSDGEAEGYVRQGVIGHLLAAHPPPGPGDPRHSPPATGWGELLAAPTVGSLPVYLVSDGDTRWATTSLRGDLGRLAVVEILGYLPDPDRP